jgi:hypothetical protein
LLTTYWALGQVIDLQGYFSSAQKYGSVQNPTFCTNSVDKIVRNILNAALSA